MLQHDATRALDTFLCTRSTFALTALTAKCRAEFEAGPHTDEALSVYKSRPFHAVDTTSNDDVVAPGLRPSLSLMTQIAPWVLGISDDAKEIVTWHEDLFFEHEVLDSCRVNFSDDDGTDTSPIGAEDTLVICGGMIFGPDFKLGLSDLLSDPFMATSPRPVDTLDPIPAAMSAGALLVHRLGMRQTTIPGARDQILAAGAIALTRLDASAETATRIERRLSGWMDMWRDRALLRSDETETALWSAEAVAAAEALLDKLPVAAGELRLMRDGALSTASSHETLRVIAMQQEIAMRARALMTALYGTETQTESLAA